jgi:hypothetical protein
MQMSRARVCLSPNCTLYDGDSGIGANVCYPIFYSKADGSVSAQSGC